MPRGKQRIWMSLKVQLFVPPDVIPQIFVELYLKCIASSFL